MRAVRNLLQTLSLIAWLATGPAIQPAFAQGLRAGTYTGTYEGGDYGSLTVTIDAHAGATCDFYSTPKQKHFVMSGSAVGFLQCQNSITSDYFWTATGFNISGPSSIAGAWEFLHNFQLTEGAFSITLPSDSPITLGGYLSGNWFNPSQGGHGFQIELTDQPDSATPGQDEMVAVWFVYTPDGSGQNWIFAQGPYDSTKNSVTLPAAIFHGPKFPFPLANYDPNSVQGNLGEWGTVTFTFSDCNNGTVSWESIASGYGNGSMSIQRLTRIAGTACP